MCIANICTFTQGKAYEFDREKNRKETNNLKLMNIWNRIPMINNKHCQENIVKEATKTSKDI